MDLAGHFGLGTATLPGDKINLKFDYFRVYETAHVPAAPERLAGVGFHYSAHPTSARRRHGRRGGLERVALRGLQRCHTGSRWNRRLGGRSVNPACGHAGQRHQPGSRMVAQLSYRAFFEDFLGGDSTWQELYLDARTYRPLGARRRHRKLAFWLFGDFVGSGTAPYLDLPAIGHGHVRPLGPRATREGRFRGERLLYGEVEYRGPLTRNGLLGMVVFLNTDDAHQPRDRASACSTVRHRCRRGAPGAASTSGRRPTCASTSASGKQGREGVYLAFRRPSEPQRRGPFVTRHC